MGVLDAGAALRASSELQAGVRGRRALARCCLAGAADRPGVVRPLPSRESRATAGPVPEGQAAMAAWRLPRLRLRLPRRAGPLPGVRGSGGATRIPSGPAVESDGRYRVRVVRSDQAWIIHSSYA